MISNSGEVKLCDFGLARFIESHKFYEQSKLNINMTTRVVTRWYRAPELLLGDMQYTEKIDIWSVGCVFAELLTEGRPPFKGDSDEDTLKLIAQRCPFPARSEWKALEKLPLFKAFSKYLWPRSNLQSPSQTVEPQNAKIVTSEGSSVHSKSTLHNQMQGASTIEVFLDKYGYLWRNSNLPMSS